MNLRDWLIVVGVVIIIGILLDGYRRMRLAKKDSLKMSLEMVGDIDTSPLDDGFNPELPGGGARVVKAGVDDMSASESASSDKLEPHISTVSIGDEPSVSFNHEADNEFTLSAQEQPLTADGDTRIDGGEAGVSVKDRQEEPAHNSIKQTANAGSLNQVGSSVDDEQLVIVLNVHSQEGSFPGIEIKKLLEACGLDHGDMSIFHRHEEDDLLSPIQFSVANAVEPGYFDPDTLHEIATPGVSFFMSLPGPKDYMKAFDYMLETAQCFARNLKGDLKDQDRSIMTAQTIEHCRQQIKEFERKQLSKVRS